jgi:hypothetical protein
LRAYVSAPFTFRDYARRVAYILAGAGIEITSRWFNREGLSPEEIARQDTLELEDSDTIVFLAIGESTGGGCWTERGMALAMGIEKIVIGAYDPQRSPFLTLADEHYPDLESFLEAA